jgi:hypothetical protein
VRGGGRALTGGTGSVSDRGGENALTERAQRQRGNGRLQGSEGIRVIRSRSDGARSRGSEGSEPFDQDRTGENQTGTDERLRVALTGGPGRQACVREAVSRGLDVRSEPDGGDQTGETDGCGRRRSSPRR